VIGQIAVAAAAAVFVLAAGAFLTTIGPWYRALRKPTWQPPDWAFGPAWTLIMTLVAVGGVLGWRATASPYLRGWMAALFVVNGVLHVSWSVLFFRLRRPDWALAEVVPFWLSIAGLIVLLGEDSGLAALALAPYIAWVSFAAFLNWTIVKLNGPFSERGNG
jgi:benzodiazapine receptor